MTIFHSNRACWHRCDPFVLVRPLGGQPFTMDIHLGEHPTDEDDAGFFFPSIDASSAPSLTERDRSVILDFVTREAGLSGNRMWVYFSPYDVVFIHVDNVTNAFERWMASAREPDNTRTALMLNAWTRADAGDVQ